MEPLAGLESTNPYFRITIDGGVFTFVNEQPVFVHSDGTWDFSRGESMLHIWQAAQRNQHELIVKMTGQIGLLSQRNVQLSHQVQALQDELGRYQEIAARHLFKPLDPRCARPMPCKPNQYAAARPIHNPSNGKEFSHSPHSPFKSAESKRTVKSNDLPLETAKDTPPQVRQSIQAGEPLASEAIDSKDEIKQAETSLTPNRAVSELEAQAHALIAVCAKLIVNPHLSMSDFNNKLMQLQGLDRREAEKVIKHARLVFPNCGIAGQKKVQLLLQSMILVLCRSEGERDLPHALNALMESLKGSDFKTLRKALKLEIKKEWSTVERCISEKQPLLANEYIMEMIGNHGKGQHTGVLIQSLVKLACEGGSVKLAKSRLVELLTQDPLAFDGHEREFAALVHTITGNDNGELKNLCVAICRITGISASVVQLLAEAVSASFSEEDLPAELCHPLLALAWSNRTDVKEDYRMLWKAFACDQGNTPAITDLLIRELCRFGDARQWLEGGDRNQIAAIVQKFLSVVTFEQLSQGALPMSAIWSVVNDLKGDLTLGLRHEMLQNLLRETTKKNVDRLFLLFALNTLSLDLRENSEAWQKEEMAVFADTFQHARRYLQVEGIGVKEKTEMAVPMDQAWVYLRKNPHLLSVLIHNSQLYGNLLVAMLQALEGTEGESRIKTYRQLFCRDLLSMNFKRGMQLFQKDLAAVSLQLPEQFATDCFVAIGPEMESVFHDDEILNERGRLSAIFYSRAREEVFAKLREHIAGQALSLLQFQAVERGANYFCIKEEHAYAQDPLVAKQGSRFWCHLTFLALHGSKNTWEHFESYTLGEVITPLVDALAHDESGHFSNEELALLAQKCLKSRNSKLFCHAPEQILRILSKRLPSPDFIEMLSKAVLLHAQQAHLTKTTCDPLRLQAGAALLLEYFEVLEPLKRKELYKSLQGAAGKLHASAIVQEFESLKAKISEEH